MSFLQGAFLVGIPFVLLLVMAQAMATLGSEIRQLRSLVIKLVAEDYPSRQIESSDPVVHDHHSAGDEYESVTAKAQRAW